MKNNYLFISCDAAKLISDKNQYGEAKVLEKIALALRLSWCNVTRAYAKNNAKLSKAIKNSTIHCLKEEERLKLKTLFNQELAKHQ